MTVWDEIKDASWTQRFVWANVTLFLTGALVIEDAANAAMFFLFVVGVVSLFRQGLPHDLSRAEKWLLTAFALYFLVGVISYNLGIKTRLGWEIMFRDIRFLFAIPAYIALRRYPPPPWLVWLTVLIGGFLLLVFGVVEYLSSEHGWRIGGSTIVIVFGHLAVSVALVCAAGAVFLRKKRWCLLLLFAALSAASAVVLSGTRGAWLAIAGSGGLLILYWFLHSDRHRRIASGLTALVVIVIAGLFLYQPVVSRIVLAKERWQQYQTINAQLVNAGLPETGCISDEVFLQVYAAHFNFGKRGLTEANVVKVPAIKEQGCKAGYAIRLQNTGNKRDWVTTAGRALAERGSGPGHATWIVRGHGWVQLGGTKASRVRIDTNDFKWLELHHPDVRWPSVVTFILPKGETLYLAPVQVRPGEYTLFYTGTSIASRFQMWEAAWRIFLKHPLFGAGTGAWQKSTTEFIATEEVSAVVARYDHAHNDYLTMLADRGLLGLASLLLLYGVPLWLFWGAFRKGQGLDRNPPAAAGLLLVGGFMISGLTETLFNHSIVITYYSLFVSILIVLARQQAITDEKDHARDL